MVFFCAYANTSGEEKYIVNHITVVLIDDFLNKYRFRKVSESNEEDKFLFKEILVSVSSGVILSIYI